MSLLGIYVALAVAGESLAYFAGIALDHYIPALAIPVGILAMLGVLVCAWPLAIRIDDRLFGHA